MTSAAETQHDIAGGIALRLFSVACFSIMAALLKLAATRGAVAPEMLFYRALFGLPVVIGWVLTSQGIGALSTRRPWAHVGRSALGIVSILFTFQALILLPLADHTTIGFTAPIFATILSWLLLKERVGVHRWAAVLVGFMGVLLVVRPGGHDAPPMLGVLVGLLAAFGTASVTITLRRLGGTEHVAAIVFWFFVASALVGALLLPAFGALHDIPTLLLLAGGGMSGGFAQLAMTASLKRAPVSVVSPFDYLQLVGAVALGWLLMRSAPTAATLAGGLLIAGSGVYTVWRERIRARIS
jgi:drug/metabolite transporter (DMT)-like permease